MDRPLAHTGWRSRSHRLVQGMLPVTLIGMIVSFTGCAYVPNVRSTVAPYRTSSCQCVSDMKLRWRARSIWKEKYEHCYGNRANARDIKEGFISGYIATANGGSGCPPIMAPQRYSCGLACLTHRKPVGTFWFEGYPLGVAAAEACEGAKCYSSSLNPQLLACMNDQGCNPGCRPCEAPTDCGCGQAGCNGECESQVIFGATADAVRNGLADSDGAVVIEHSTAPVPIPTDVIESESTEGNLPAPGGLRDGNAPPLPEPKDVDVDKDRVSEVVPAESPVAENAQRAVVDGPVEMPNMQVRFDMNESDWLFGDVDVARSLLQIETTADLDETISTDTTH